MDLEVALVDELRRVHGAHTVILYGSRARGGATDESDIDVAAYADVAETSRDARAWPAADGLFLDVFVYPTALASTPDADMLKLRRSKVLLDERGLAAPLLKLVAELDERGPPPLPASELTMRRVWATKMLARVRRGDVEAHYRQHWLLFSLLEDLYAFRGEWYRGPKEALATLQAHEPDLFAAFERALAPGAPIEALESLVARVCA